MIIFLLFSVADNEDIFKKNKQDDFADFHHHVDNFLLLSSYHPEIFAHEKEWLHVTQKEWLHVTLFKESGYVHITEDGVWCVCGVCVGVWVCVCVCVCVFVSLCVCLCVCV